MGKTCTCSRCRKRISAGEVVFEIIKKLPDGETPSLVLFCEKCSPLVLVASSRHLSSQQRVTFGVNGTLALVHLVPLLQQIISTCNFSHLELEVLTNHQLLVTIYVGGQKTSGYKYDVRTRKLSPVA